MSTTTTDNRPRITDRQRAVYEWICATYAQTGAGVGVRQISEAFKFQSPGGAYCHLTYLEKRGYVKRTPGRANSIVPILEG